MNRIDTTLTAQEAAVSEASVRDFVALLKPRVMSLVVFTALVGLVAAPGSIHPGLAAIAILCIALGGGASGALNMWYDADIDAVMGRTAKRPIPSGKVLPGEALGFGLFLSGLSVVTLGMASNWVAAGLLAFTIFFYAVVYTMWLKRSTPQNIVIGGAAGAFPPMIGWAAVTGGFSLESIVMFAIIFIWTPPHFWALALMKKADYGRAGVPMLPNVVGDDATRRQIFWYTVAMAATGCLPALLGYNSIAYLLVAAASGLWMIKLAVDILRAAGGPEAPRASWRMFGHSMFYLFGLFLAILLDKLAMRAGLIGGSGESHGLSRTAEAHARGAAPPALAQHRDRARPRRAHRPFLPHHHLQAGRKRPEQVDLMAAKRNDLRVAAYAGGFALTMLGVSFAAVPLYDWFCRTTGFGGTTMVAKSAPDSTGTKPVTVRFDANVNGLPWRFEAETTSVTLLPGEVRTVFYRLTNTSDRETTGVANYGVSPDLAGGYFSKIQCFCFTDQTLQPGETREEAVVFFVDPAIEKNADSRIINTITLSYTFFPSKTQSKPLAANSGTNVIAR